jgi:hypothetical protein
MDKSTATKRDAELKKTGGMEKRRKAEGEQPNPDQKPGEKALRQIEKPGARLQEDITASNVQPLDLDAVVSEIFLRTLSRPPTPQEIIKAKEDVAAAKDQVDGVRDVLWALLNTREFLVNH